MLLAVALVGVLLPQSHWDDGWDRELPQRITHVAIPSGNDVVPPAQPPSLRGCCGAPTQFHWVFLDGGKEATAGTPFRTRVFALDAQGRQARASACGALRVDLGLSGRARLSQASSALSWRRGAELQLDIENEMAEVVEAEVRIESPIPTADVLLHSSQIRFASGPAHTFALSVQSRGDTKTGQAGEVRKGGSSASPATMIWPVRVQLEVLVTVQDRFGNLAPVSSSISMTARKEQVRLRCSRPQSIEMTPQSGILGFDASGEGRAFVTGVEAGVAKFWLETVGGNSSSRLHQLNRHPPSSVYVKFEPPPTPGSASLKESRLSPEDAKWHPLAEEVKDAFVHAWRGYRQYAWGRDELQPVSKTGKDTFGGIGMTALDSLTTLWLMGLEKEYEEAAAFVRDELDFSKVNMEVSVFEMIIRAVGGLLGAHALSGQQFFLDKARDLGVRLLPAFNSSSRLPYPKWNIAHGTGKSSSEPTILAEAGSCQLEFRYLAAKTGDRQFRRVADAAFDAIQSAGVPGLMPVYLTPPDHVPVRALASKFAVGALADSYYEYLLKQWLQSPGEARFKDLFLTAADEMPGLVRPRPLSADASSKLSTSKIKPMKLVEVAPGGEAIWKMDHLSCFAPAMLVLGMMSIPKETMMEKGRNSTWWQMADGVTQSCMEMWTSSSSGLAPEFVFLQSKPPFDFKEVPWQGRHSFLRPETAESLFYLYRYTRDEKYREWGKTMFNAISTHGKVDAGFASVQDVNVVPTVKVDEMQSFVMAETLKYLFLLFSPAEALDLDRYVLNTEGHPLLKLEHW